MKKQQLHMQKSWDGVGCAGSGEARYYKTQKFCSHIICSTKRRLAGLSGGLSGAWSQVAVVWERKLWLLVFPHIVNVCKLEEGFASSRPELGRL